MEWVVTKIIISITQDLSKDLGKIKRIVITNIIITTIHIISTKTIVRVLQIDYLLMLEDSLAWEVVEGLCPLPKVVRAIPIIMEQMQDFSLVDQ